MRMRRVLSVLTLVVLLMTVPQCGWAISGQEALFGGVEVGQEPAEQGEPQAEAGAPTAAALAAAGQYPTLRLGDRDGEDSMAYIVFMQNRLIELGYLRDAADGVFGQNTETAVRAFQRNNNLEDTGIADAATQQLLFSDLSTLVPASEDSTMFGGEVTRVQNVLGMWGFYGGKVDGLSGSGTESAIVQFKEYIHGFDPMFGVTPTPSPTPTMNPEGMFAEMDMVFDLPLEVPVDTSATDATITPALMEFVDGDREFQVYRMTVKKGDTNAEALRVQTRLHQLNYLYAADGNFGALSENALKYFQRKNGLPETGIADEQTQRVLFSAKALEGEEYVFPYKLVVDVGDQRVYVGEWTGSTYEGPIHTYKCATGKKDTPTPLGTYQAGGKAGGEWYYFKQFHCYAKWAYQIVGGVLFHSNTVSQPKGKPGDGGLGHRASHGCVRLPLEAAKWIYDNCPSGTTVVVQE